MNDLMIAFYAMIGAGFAIARFKALLQNGRITPTDTFVSLLMAAGWPVAVGMIISEMLMDRYE